MVRFSVLVGCLFLLSNVNAEDGNGSLEAKELKKGHSTYDHSHSGHGHIEEPHAKDYKSAKFKTKITYRLTIDADQVLPENYRENRVANHDHSGKAKNVIYHQLKNILPATATYRIRRAYVNLSDNKKMDIVVESKDTIDRRSVLAMEGVSYFDDENKRTFSNKVKRVKPDESTVSLPDGWNKETGYSEVLKRLTAGERVVKVSIVSDTAFNVYQGRTFGDTILAEIQRKLERTEALNDQEGYFKYFGAGKKENVIWITREVDLKALYYIYEHEQVLNIVPR